MWEHMMADPLTYGMTRKVDFGRDGWVDAAELYTAVAEGRGSLLGRPYEAKYDMVRQLAGYCQSGFTGLGRDEGVFMFIQQRAVFIAAGTWDQALLREQAAGQFELGVMNYPRPTRDDPEFGDVMEGPMYEFMGGTFSFAITRTSKHPDIALDFMQYLGSKDGNEELNQIIGWIPAIKETRMKEELQAFDPVLKGIYGTAAFGLGSETVIKWEQVYSDYKVNEKLGFTEMMSDFEEVYRRRGREEFMELVRNGRRGLPGNERWVAPWRARMVEAAAGGAFADVADMEEARYRHMVLSQLMGRGFNEAVLMRIRGRHDPCIVPRAVPCVTAAAAIVLYDNMLGADSL
jgi:hypothetical protein